MLSTDDCLPMLVHALFGKVRGGGNLDGELVEGEVFSGRKASSKGDQV